MRELIGMQYQLAKEILESRGYSVREVENTADDKHRYDVTLVLKVDIDGDIATVTTAKFAEKTV